MSYSGYIMVLDEPARREWLLSRRAEAAAEFEDPDWRFTDTLSSPDWHPKAVEICFVSFDGDTLDLATLAERGRSVANAKYAVTFSHLVEVGIPLAAIEIQLGGRLAAHFVRSSSGRGARVPQATWAALFDTAKALRPQVASSLDRLERLRRTGRRPLAGRGMPQLALERDAIGVALDIFGADRKGILSSWSPPESAEEGEAPLPPFLRGLRSTRLREDQMVANDARTLPGWDVVRQHEVGTATFRKRSGEYLTVWNVNRTTVENALGVDLVYYNHRYDAYVMVQYKRLIRDGHDQGEPVFRLSSGSYEDEIQRMRRFVADNPVPPCDRPDRYRLEPATFYFKLCEAETVTPLSGSLIKGMYVPLPYWEALLSAGALAGPGGGLRVSYGSARRHLANQPFIGLVQDGWIGSRGTTSEAITRIIEQRLTERASVLLAVSGGEAADDHSVISP